MIVRETTLFLRLVSARRLLPFRQVARSRRHPLRRCRRALCGQAKCPRLLAVNQLTVGNSVQPSGCADALNPEAAILTLLDAAIAERITIGAICRFLCGLIELALGEKKALCPLEILLAPCTALCAAFYASHGFAPLDRAARSEENRSSARC